MKTLKNLYMTAIAIVVMAQIASGNAGFELLAWGVFGIYAVMVLLDETVDQFGQILAAAILFIPVGVYVL